MSVSNSGDGVDLQRYQDPLVIQAALRESRVAVVGLSSNHLRPSNFVGFYLQRHGYQMVPVNPRETEIFGQRSYPSLADIPEPVGVVDVRAILKSVREPRHVREQILDPHLPVHGTRDEVGGDPGDVDLEILPLGYEARHPILKLKAAFFIEHHERHARDGLGHRIDSEQRVLSHRLLPCHVHLTKGLKVRDASASENQRQDPRDFSWLDVALHEMASDLPEPLLTHACGLRINLH